MDKILMSTGQLLSLLHHKPLLDFSTLVYYLSRPKSVYQNSVENSLQVSGGKPILDLGHFLLGLFCSFDSVETFLLRILCLFWWNFSADKTMTNLCINNWHININFSLSHHLLFKTIQNTPNNIFKIQISI